MNKNLRIKVTLELNYEAPDDNNTLEELRYWIEEVHCIDNVLDKIMKDSKEGRIEGDGMGCSCEYGNIKLLTIDGKIIKSS